MHCYYQLFSRVLLFPNITVSVWANRPLPFFKQSPDHLGDSVQSCFITQVVSTSPRAPHHDIVAVSLLCPSPWPLLSASNVKDASEHHVTLTQLSAVSHLRNRPGEVRSPFAADTKWDLSVLLRQQITHSVDERGELDLQQSTLFLKCTLRRLF